MKSIRLVFLVVFLSASVANAQDAEELEAEAEAQGLEKEGLKT